VNTGSPGPVYANASTGHTISLARRSFSEGGKPGDDDWGVARLETVIASQRIARIVEDQRP
jgi:hypothetical protein